MRQRAIRLGEPLLFLFAAAVWLAPLWREPGGFAFWRQAAFSDLLVSHFPNAELMRRSIATWGAIPLWNPHILSGAPFAANPLAGLFYPPSWLGVLLPAGLGFNLYFLLHLAWAGWGAARLAADEGVGRAGRILAGLLFAGTPKTIGHIGLGHLGLVAAVCWTPWLVLLAGRTANSARAGSRVWLRQAAAAGALGGLIFLADPRWLIPAGLLSGSYALWRFVQEKGLARTQLARAAGSLGAALVFAAGISAALALPLVEFSSLSTRRLMTDADRSALQLPAPQLAGILLPDLGGWPEWLAYAGIVAAALALGAALRWKARSRYWCLAAAAGWILSLGDQTLLFGAFEAIVPGAGLLRVPPRFLWIAALSLSILAAHGLDGLAADAKGRLPREVVGPIGVGLGLGVVLVLGGSSGRGVPQALAGAAALSGIAALWSVLAARMAARLLPLGLILVAAVDLWWVDSSLLEVRSSDTALTERAIIAETIGEHEGHRVFSPSYSIPQQTAALAGIELADGVDPLQLQPYVAAMAEATGFDVTRYGVTLPPFPADGPASDWEPRLDLARLGLLSVASVVSDYPLRSEALEGAREVEGVYIYSNPLVRPRAWVEAEESGGLERAWAPVLDWDWSPNRISVRAQGPGRLVFSEISYPGWRAELDGEPVPLGTAHSILRAVRIPSGEHSVALEFRPWRVIAGASASLVTAVALAALWIKR